MNFQRPLVFLSLAYFVQGLGFVFIFFSSIGADATIRQDWTNSPETTE